MKFEISSEAHIDILDAMEFYERSAGIEIAADFYAEFRQKADQIASRPSSFPFQIKSYRRANLYRFPYSLLFRVIDDTTVRIIAVRHDRRHPSFGTHRT